MRRLQCGLALLLVATLMVFGSAALQAATSKPISCKGLTEALKIGGLKQTELVELIKERGVNFELTPETEAELESAGANAKILEAVRQNYRGTTSASASTNNQPGTGGRGEHETTRADVSEHAKEKQAIASINDVKKLYIEKMPNDLDTYIKSEISRQLPMRLVIVLEKNDADAVMTGTSTDKQGTVIVIDRGGKLQLWTGEEGVRRGGAKEIAKKLVHSLNRSIQPE